MLPRAPPRGSPAHGRSLPRQPRVHQRCGGDPAQTPVHVQCPHWHRHVSNAASTASRPWDPWSGPEDILWLLLPHGTDDARPPPPSHSSPPRAVHSAATPPPDLSRPRRVLSSTLMSLPLPSLSLPPSPPLPPPPLPPQTPPLLHPQAPPSSARLPAGRPDCSRDREVTPRCTRRWVINGLVWALVGTPSTERESLMRRYGVNSAHWAFQAHIRPPRDKARSQGGNITPQVNVSADC